MTHPNHQITVENVLPELRGPVPLSHLFLRRFVQPGDSVVDATCGNGNDTLLLAELTTSCGYVWAFDIQEEAICQSEARLSQAGLSGHVRLIRDGHENLLQYVDKPVKAVVFNLGYLPGGDRQMITRPDTTTAALELTSHLLQPGGIILTTIYHGHAGGDTERQAVERWAAALAPQQFHVWRMGQCNAAGLAPYLILIQKALR